MIKLFAASLKLCAVGFDVLFLGECVVAVTKVTLADFQQFIFPSSLRLPSPVRYVTLLCQPPPALPPVAVHQPFCLSLRGWDPPEGPAPQQARPQPLGSRAARGQENLLSDKNHILALPLSSLSGVQGGARW